MSEQRLDRLRQMTTEEQAEAFKRMNEAIERIVADPSAVPLESMIEEMEDVRVFHHRTEGHWVVWGCNTTAYGDTPRAAIEALYAAWRERE